MNLEDYRKLEARLKEHRPAPVNPALRERIAWQLQRTRRNRRIARLRSRIAWGSLALAASMLIVFGILLFNGRLALMPEPVAEELAMDSEGSSTDGFRPVLAENELRGRTDEGIVLLRNGLPARRYRYEFVDRVVWENPENGATVEMEIPREEVVMVPVRTF